jgi:phage gp46-like protein
MNRFQGDPSIQITENGARMRFISGQPILDQGLENAVQISLFTKPGWWGNILLSESQKIGSNFQQNRTIIDVQTVNDIRQDAEKALDWIKNKNITVMNPSGNQIKTQIELQPDGNDINKFIYTNIGRNWIGQAQNPAHERNK